jgi:H+/Cl- antiporter ClcA
MAAENSAPPPGDRPAPSAGAVLRLLALAALVGVGVSLAAWCFLEGIHQIQVGLFTDLPEQLGYEDGAPLWWSLPVCAVGGLITALAIVRLPGAGGHVPAHGLVPSPTQPIELPGVVLAALASVGFGLVLGPEAPLLALGGGLGIFAVRSAKADAPSDLVTVVSAAGAFAAMSFLFEAPLIAAVLLSRQPGSAGSVCRSSSFRACSRPASARSSRSASGRSPA